jgi:predicted TPR repeat methyltransferase
LEWFLQAVRLDNDFVEAFFNAGVAYQDIGELEDAENYFNAAISRKKDLPRAYRYLSEIYRARGKSDLQQKTLMRWLDVSPSSATAEHLLAASQGETSVLRASDDFIREEFDDFADSFNKKLEKLEYTTPEKLMGLLGRQDIPANSVARALDAGCGTGLCGHGISRFANKIVGVDLSSKMLKHASNLDVYTELVENELVEYMRAHPAAFDLVVSADTLVYFGDLESVFAGARTSLSPGGLFAFSVERVNQEEQGAYRLQDSGRYCHAESYVESSLMEAGFRVMAKEETSIRMDSHKPVIGLLFVAKREEGGAT